MIFKSNEYADLLAADATSPPRRTPCSAFVGRARYYDPRYRDGFALVSGRQVRDEMGLTNVKLMIPFCRTVDEDGRCWPRWPHMGCGGVRTA